MNDPNQFVYTNYCGLLNAAATEVYRGGDSNRRNRCFTCLALATINFRPWEFNMAMTHYLGVLALFQHWFGAELPASRVIEAAEVVSKTLPANDRATSAAVLIRALEVLGFVKGWDMHAATVSLKNLPDHKAALEYFGLEKQPEFQDGPIKDVKTEGDVVTLLHAVWTS